MPVDAAQNPAPTPADGLQVADGPPATGTLVADREADRSVRPPVKPARLAWLDALRGFAALCVVFDHASYEVLHSVRDLVYQWFDPGQYGVFVFFLVSGYIIPASLERKGSLRRFWIGRAFRLYPLYLLALALTVAGAAGGWWDIAGAQNHPLTAVASWLLMMPNILSGPNEPNVIWTLSYEMVFYLVVAALFSWRAHRPSGGYALGLAVAAVALGGVMPMWWLYRAAGRHALALDVTADALVLGGIAVTVAASSRMGGSGAGRTVARIGASVAALTALVLLACNQEYPYPWSSFTILALMFTGTLIYRADQGQAGRLRALAISLAVLVLTVGAGLWHGGSMGTQWKWQWMTSLVGAAITFAVGLALRHRRVPAALSWLGLVSYSVYLLHLLVVQAYAHVSRHLHGASTGAQVIIALGLLGAVLLVSAATYYGVEKPMQKAGRWLAARAGLLPPAPRRPGCAIA
jgi:peptidoglycan/LPS O-acetylase OafA/YrhL